MNPKVRRFHRYFLSICVFLVLAGMSMMLMGDQYGMVDEGGFLALVAGFLAGIPAFYFASQVGNPVESPQRSRRFEKKPDSLK